jgi:hypothetical protein
MYKSTFPLLFTFTSKWAVVVPSDDGSTHDIPTCTLSSVSSNVHLHWVGDTSTGVPFSVLVGPTSVVVVGSSSISNSYTSNSVPLVAFLYTEVVVLPLTSAVRPPIGGANDLQPGSVGPVFGVSLLLTALPLVSTIRRKAASSRQLTALERPKTAGFSRN